MKPPQTLSRTIEATQDELIVNGPGKVILRLNNPPVKSGLEKNVQSSKLKLALSLLPSGAEVPILVIANFEETENEDDNQFVHGWQLK